MTSKQQFLHHQPKSFDYSDKDDAEDYLQDPELWIDELPQPFRMLDNLLNEVLYRSWEVIESKELERRRKAAQVRIPEVSEWTAISAVDEHSLGGVCVVQCGKEGYVFAGGSHGLMVLRAGEEYSDLELVAQSGDEKTDITSLDVVWSKGVHFIAAVCNSEVKIYALIKDSLTSICSISPQTEDQRVVAASFSPSCSHLGLTLSHPDSGTQLEFHKLPLSPWHAELNQYLEKIAATTSAAGEGEGSQVFVEGQQEEMAYSKSVLLSMFHPPKSLTPCSASDPAAAYRNVVEGRKNHLPTGELHILTQKYFENRRKAYESQRPQLASQHKDTISCSQSLPKYHFLYYKNSCRQVQPCYVAVWWENHTQLFVYPLASEASKNPAAGVEPYWLLPQASSIVASAVNSDSRLLALAQKSGTVTVWNLQTEFCERVSIVAQKPDCVACVEFFGDIVGAGTEKGDVMALCTGQDRGKPPFFLNQRVRKQMEVYGDLFESSGYNIGSRLTGLKVNTSLPSVLSSVHADGSVILWSFDDQEALCKLCLPSSVIPGQCSYTSDGRRLIALTGPDESSTGLISVDLSSPGCTSLLAKHWKREKEDASRDEDEQLLTSGSMMDAVERQLMNYINLRHAQHDADSARWSKRWAELHLEIEART